jgi:CRISPR system Cascade subunit CasD
MKYYLLFRLYGALSSWGDIAVGDVRPSYRYPSKSAIIGLIAAALGMERDEHEEQAELAKLIFSVRVDVMGSPIEDYHTVQTPHRETINKYKRMLTRLDEIEAMNFRVKTENSKKAREQAGAIQSRRTYYCDSIYTVALCENEKDKINWQILGVSKLQDFIKFLRNPQFVLYLGRKSCPLALPLESQIKPGKNCIEAFQQAEFKFANELQLILEQSTSIQYYTQEELENAQMKLTRRDQPVNRTTWQFTERDEYYFSE